MKQDKEALKSVEKHKIEEKIARLEASAYLDSDLGLNYQSTQSVFKLWAPDAQEVFLKLYKSGDIREKSCYAVHPMSLQKNVWRVAIKEDLKGFYYTYEIVRENQSVEVVDLYAKAVGIDGNRGAIIDLRETNPDNWFQTERAMQEKLTDAFIWEVHVEDFSSAVNSGISEKNRGKYLAFTEKETSLHSQNNVATGVQYLKEMGINYVHLLPAFDYENQELNNTYNWGYDPKNFNVPEGKYASNPSDPKTRIFEFKAMVQSLHEEKIGVIMDLVFNHTPDTAASWFQRTVPDYYYRQDQNGAFANGSACGNEIATERRMVRKFIVDSVLYWAKEYRVDGFRFDLMGLIDVATMNQIRQALNQEGLEKVILYGEPWDAGSNEITLPNQPANKTSLSVLTPGIAVFNSNLRDQVKGDVFEETDGGFIQGMNGKKQKKEILYDKNLALAICGNQKSLSSNLETGWAETPAQVIAYVSAHDNLSLWDKLVATSIREKDAASFQRNEELVQMNKLAAAILFTSQGGIFMQAGEEFARTKLGDENSYCSEIKINQIDWERRLLFKDLNEFYKGMQQIRQAYAPLRDWTDTTAKHIQVSDDKKENLLAYTIPNISDTGIWRQVAVIINSSSAQHTLQLKSYLGLPRQWQIIADNKGAGTVSKGIIKGNTCTIAAQSLLILAESSK